MVNLSDKSGFIKCMVPVPLLYTEVSIFRDNSSAIVIGDNSLPIIVIAQNSLDLSNTDIAFVIYFVIADKLIIAVNDSLCTQCSKLGSWRYGKIYGVDKVLMQIKKCLFVVFNPTAESVNCSLFLKNLKKLFCDLTYKKKLRQTY